jgi:hypothetical protein
VTARSRRLGRTAALLGLAGAVALCATGLASRGFGAAGLDRLRSANDRYLSASFDKTLRTFGVLSGVKVALAVVQGSDAGFGIHVEVGDVVQSAYDYVDIAWRATLLSAAVLLGTRYLLAAAELAAPWVLAAALAAAWAALCVKWAAPSRRGLRALFQDAAWTAGIASLTLMLLLPASVAGGRWFSERITRPSVAEAEAGFREMRAALEPPSPERRTGLWSAITEGKERFTRTVDAVRRKAGALSEWVLKLVAGFLFDCIVFPLLLFWLVTRAARRGIRYVLDLRRGRRLAGDIGAAVAGAVAAPPLGGSRPAG